MLAETIVPIGSFSSVWSAFGVIYLIICLLCILGGKTKGWITVLNLAILGACWVGIQTPNVYRPVEGNGAKGYYPYIWYQGKWQNEQELNINNIYCPLNRWEQPWENAKIYKMHYDGLSPKLYHPDALYWAPLTACGIALLLSPGWLLFTVCGVMMLKSVRR